ncbi:hypothetical protein QFC19_000152 [Naganishia cerealis]|uniref:Uncharacterized protein n=1 Tax=Naganishia cerealis TaxID=610337 RepID=A0ACC2WS83_9TREE|nr:hypothetical protein QFC19_000152 [Naganishia cerealis]
MAYSQGYNQGAYRPPPADPLQGYHHAPMSGYPPHPQFAQYPPAPSPPPMQHHAHSQPMYDPAADPYHPPDVWLSNGGGPPITTLQPAGAEMYMPDTRMMSPPPFLPHHSSGYLYADGQANPYPDPPHRGYSPYPGAYPAPGGGGMPGSYTPAAGDEPADQPLLQRFPSAAAEPGRYGNPFGASTGDLGAVPAEENDHTALGGGGVNPDEPVTTLRYGAAPEGRMIRRLKTTKRVP